MEWIVKIKGWSPDCLANPGIPRQSVPETAKAVQALIIDIEKVFPDEAQRPTIKPYAALGMVTVTCDAETGARLGQLPTASESYRAPGPARGVLQTLHS